MSSKADPSKRTGEDITKQAKKIKGVDVRSQLYQHNSRLNSCPVTKHLHAD